MCRWNLAAFLISLKDKEYDIIFFDMTFGILAAVHIIPKVDGANLSAVGPLFDSPVQNCEPVGFCRTKSLPSLLRDLVLPMVLHFGIPF